MIVTRSIIPPEPRSEQIVKITATSSQGGLDVSSLSDQQESTTDNSLLQPTFGKEWQRLEFDNAVKFLMFFNKTLLTGKKTLYKWQIEELEKISFARPTQQHPFKYCLCACNGSGKDIYFNAPIALFLICTQIRFRVFITSASVRQLDEQTEKHIVSMANEINHWAVKEGGFPKEILQINKHRITCLLSGSEIVLHVTDDEGRAEGYHPFDDGEFCIIINEAKSVKPEIFRAIRRCTGYSYFLLVSSPGEPKGDFHYAFVNWYHKRRITVFDCPHHSKQEYEDDKRQLGAHDSYFRSKWLAAFTTIGGKCVLDGDALEKLRSDCRAERVKLILQNQPIRIGVDLALSGAGDETVISVWKGNKQLGQHCFRIENAIALADQIENIFLLYIPKEQKDHPYIWIDDGGVGRPLIHILWRKGWTGIKPVLNQSRAKNTKHYRNRGAELWHKFARLVTAGAIIPIDDAKLYEQLSSRKFKESTAGLDKVTLESKKAMMAEGLPSPDRADAAVLAFTDVKVKDYLDAFELQEAPKVKKTDLDRIREIEDFLRKGEYKRESSSRRLMGSLNAYYGRLRKQLTYN